MCKQFCQNDRINITSPSNFAGENSEEFLEPDEAVLYMISFRGSLLQFDLMTRQEDYERLLQRDMNTKRGKSRDLKH